MTMPEPPPIAADGTWALPEGEGPCRTWPLPASPCGCLPEDPVDFDAQHRHAVEAATELLWRLTAGRFGLCRETVRPCTRRCRPHHPRPGTGGMAPDIIAGRWVNLACGCARRSDDCSCGTAPDELWLPGPVYWPTDPAAGPLYDLRVIIDGAPLPRDAYRLFEHGQLLRIDGAPWPACQDLTAADDADGAFTVDYWRGMPVPPGGRRAVALLACELWRACVDGPDSCALPKRVQTVQREGITYTMIDPLEFLAEGRIGLTEVDAWVAAVNPGGVRSPSAVLSPDLGAYRSPNRPWTSTPGR